MLINNKLYKSFQVVRNPGQQGCDELNKESDVVAITTPVAAASNAIATTEQCEEQQYQSNLQQPSNTVQYEGQKLEGVTAAVNMANATALAGDVLPTPEYSQMAKPIATPATLPKNVAVEQIEGQQTQSQLQQLLRSNAGQSSPASTGVAKEYGKQTGVTDAHTRTVTLVELADMGTTVEETHVDVMELEYAASTGYKLMNVVIKQSQISAGMKQATTEILKPTIAFITTVARTTSKAEKSRGKGTGQVLHITSQSATHQRQSDTKNNKGNNWTVANLSIFAKITLRSTSPNSRPKISTINSIRSRKHLSLVEMWSLNTFSRIGPWVDPEECGMASYSLCATCINWRRLVTTCALLASKLIVLTLTYSHIRCLISPKTACQLVNNKVINLGFLVIVPIKLLNSDTLLQVGPIAFPLSNVTSSLSSKFLA
ncbi:hypothetical protein A4A49_10740 [Nicotiana attenuata]|uniref:Uncharacterized protein n=1 Tax=Nicotiana attenuata TaxID=49451 RepID=A0A1J6JFM8_NICAT|nr:hypothetical protein A4A49_10740 [Nicotiana attenuata]